MVTFRRLTLVLFPVLLSIMLWNILIYKPVYGYTHTFYILICLLIFTVYLGISIGLSFVPCSNFHLPVICRAGTDEKSVSVTFDDGPDPVKTPGILEVLKKHDVKATFFCIGKKLSGNESLLKKMDDEGHLICNHSYSHSNWFDLFPAHRMHAEIIKTNHMIVQITGKMPPFFRPPFGVVNPMVKKALKNMPLKVICWNIRSLDTLIRDPRKIKKKILRKLKPGSIILLHDHTPFTENHLDDMLAAIKDAGYGIVPLDKLLKQPAYAI
jgi:peptidoglycan-N-acetylglucosamine deacetylase